MNLIQVIKNSAGLSPHKTFIICEKEKRTYRQFYERVLCLGAGFDSIGIKKDDKVAILLSNSTEFVETYFAVISRGAVIVPLNTFLKTAEIEYILNDCGVKALVTSSEFYQVIKKININKMRKLERIISVDSMNDIKTMDYNSLFEAKPAEPVIMSQNDVAVIIYTSGTTGFPKGAMLTHQCLTSDVENARDIIAVSDKDVFMCFLPMFHSFSFMANIIVPMYCRSKIVIVRSIQPFTRVIKNLLFHRVTVFVAIPQIYILMAEKHIPFYVLLLNNIRVCVSGGASIPAESIKKFEAKFKKPLVEGYGLSEASPICTLNSIFYKRVPGSIGKPLENVEIRIRDDNGKEVKTGEAGEITVKGDNVMKGYFNNPQATAETIKDGWLYTGDMAKKDEEGYIYILDRKKDMVIVNGMNVYPREVEEILYQYPAIADAAVVGEKHETHGEIPVAVVLLKDGSTTDEAAIRKFCREHIANYKVPHRVEFWKEMPRNAQGKVLKREIRRMINEGKAG